MNQIRTSLKLTAQEAEMTVDEYLECILRDQTFAPDSPKLTQLRDRREEVRGVLRDEFGSSPRINEAGSKKKGTMIRESYDLDLTCYFPKDDKNGTETLEVIYYTVEEILREHYHTERKGSAIRLWDVVGEVDFQVDVVPGRYVTGSSGDVFLHRTSGDKKRLKTNLDVHVDHVRQSGVIDAIKLMKFWRERESINFKTFVLELLVIKMLKDSAAEPVSQQLMRVWNELAENGETLSVEDPANPSGNDLSDLLKPVRTSVSYEAQRDVRNNRVRRMAGRFRGAAERQAKTD